MAGRLGLRIAVHAGDAVVTSMGDHLQQGQAAVMGEAIAFARQLLAAVRTLQPLPPSRATPYAEAPLPGTLP